MRPLHYVLLEPGAMPLNRAAKSDYVRLRESAGSRSGKNGLAAQGVNLQVLFARQSG